ncbi:MAG: TetR/AcrR family transcriptional regulator [Hyphomonadaceae bacterium]|nr:TetR/AcrR family transcriptional regulator [Hyphomonadaceae bacterium]
MPRLKPDVQRARREHILDAAQQCFARTGFHRTSINDICKAAGVSPGAVYVYFDSKEALMAGISERDRAEFAERLAALATAPDFMEALRQLGEQYFLEEPVDTHRMCIDIGLEATRNPRIGEIHQRFDRFIVESFETLFQNMKNEGRIAPVLDIPTVVKVFMVISDGMFWRRAVDPNFDPQAVMAAVVHLVAELLKPVSVSGATSAAAKTA